MFCVSVFSSNFARSLIIISFRGNKINFFTGATVGLKKKYSTQMHSRKVTTMLYMPLLLNTMIPKSGTSSKLIFNLAKFTFKRAIFQAFVVIDPNHCFIGSS